MKDNQQTQKEMEGNEKKKREAYSSTGKQILLSDVSQKVPIYDIARAVISTPPPLNMKTSAQYYL